jgi:DNA (cytosine-5)-methyltransferase 1
LRVLDLFCGAGMASDGYAAAGFEPTGVDIVIRPAYPYEFQWGNALSILRNKAFVESFDLVHASPPCQAHTRARHLRDAQGGHSRHGDLLTPTLRLLRECDVPWIVENVPGSPGMSGAVVECGSAYGLKVRRHRLFLASFPIAGSGCKHAEQGKPIGVYHVMGDTCKGVCRKTGKLVVGGSTANTVEEARQAMGVSRDLSWDELKEGFPPAYTEHIGRQAAKWIQGSTRDAFRRITN